MIKQIVNGLIVGVLLLNLLVIGIAMAEEVPEGIIVELVDAPESIGPSSSGIYVYNITNIGETREMEISLLSPPDYITATIIPDIIELNDNENIFVYIYVDTSEYAPDVALELDLKIEDVNDRAVGHSEIFSVKIQAKIDYSLGVQDMDYDLDTLSLTAEEESYINENYDRYYTMYANDFFTVRDIDYVGDDGTGTDLNEAEQNSMFVHSTMIKLINYGNVPLNVDIESEVDTELVNAIGDDSNKFIAWDATTVVIEDTEELGVDYQQSLVQRVGTTDRSIGDGSNLPGLTTGDITTPDGSNGGEGMTDNNVDGGSPSVTTDAQISNWQFSQGLIGSSDLMDLSGGSLTGIAPSSLSYLGNKPIEESGFDYGGNIVDGVTTDGDYSGSGAFDGFFSSDTEFSSYDDDYFWQDNSLPGQSVGMAIDVMHEDSGIDLYDQISEDGITVIPVRLTVTATNIQSGNDFRQILVNVVLRRGGMTEAIKPDVAMFGVTAVGIKDQVLDHPNQTAIFTVDIECKGFDYNKDGKITIHIKCLGLFTIDIDGDKDLEKIWDSDRPLTGKENDGGYTSYSGWRVQPEVSNLVFADTDADGLIDETKRVNIYVYPDWEANGGDKFVFEVIVSNLGSGMVSNVQLSEGGQVNDFIYNSLQPNIGSTRGPLGLVPSIFGEKSYSSSVVADSDGFLSSRVDEAGDTITNTIITILIIGVMSIIIIVIVGMVLFARGKKRYEGIIKKGK